MGCVMLKALARQISARRRSTSGPGTASLQASNPPARHLGILPRQQWLRLIDRRVGCQWQVGTRGRGLHSPSECANAGVIIIFLIFELCRILQSPCSPSTRGGVTQEDRARRAPGCGVEDGPDCADLNGAHREGGAALRAAVRCDKLERQSGSRSHQPSFLRGGGGGSVACAERQTLVLALRMLGCWVSNVQRLFLRKAPVSECNISNTFFVARVHCDLGYVVSHAPASRV